MSNNIRKYRQEIELSQYQFSRLAGISTGYLSHLENGTRANPSVKVMKNISFVLKKPISDIFML